MRNCRCWPRCSSPPRAWPRRRAGRQTGRGADASPSSDPEPGEAELVELQAHRYIGSGAGVPILFEIPIMETNQVPSHRDPAVVEGLDADAGAGRVADRAAAVVLAD